jgi:SAM-dependent methyltransferase
MAYSLALSEDEQRRYRLMAQWARAEEGPAWAAAGIRPGAAIADVGCGPGAILRLLAEEAGHTGRADGVDQSSEAVAAALAAVDGLTQATVREAEATATGLPFGAYDVVTCRHVLAHNGGREAAIVGHLAALARPGGAVYLVDVDTSLLWMRPADPDVMDLQARYRAYHEGRGNDLTVGRSLGELLEGAGLTVEIFRCGGPVIRLPVGVRGPAWAARDALLATGLATADDVARWDAAFTRLDAQAPRPWGASPACVAVGRVSAT